MHIYTMNCYFVFTDATVKATLPGNFWTKGFVVVLVAVGGVVGSLIGCLLYCSRAPTRHRRNTPAVNEGM